MNMLDNYLLALPEKLRQRNIKRRFARMERHLEGLFAEFQGFRDDGHFDHFVTYLRIAVRAVAMDVARYKAHHGLVTEQELVGAVKDAARGGL